jgi:hypothetical protein
VVNTPVAVLTLDAAASNAVGLTITGNATAGGVTLAPTGGGSNEDINLVAKASGKIAQTGAAMDYRNSSGSRKVRLLIDTPSMQWSSDFAIGFSNATADGTLDTIITRAGAANWRHGDVNAASPVNQIISTQGSRSGTDTNVAGANMTVQSGIGTGNAAPSSLILRSPVAVASGTGAQTIATGLTIIGGTAQLTPYTVATLPTASATLKGSLAYVTDATLTIITGLGLAPTGGGSNIVPVFCDGTNWLVI